MKDAIAAAVLPGALVNELGFKYIGYVDGHNVKALVKALNEAKQVHDGPVIVHALTTKGKGHPAAENDYYKWHATGPFDLKTGKPIKSSDQSADLHESLRRHAVRVDGEGREDRGADGGDARRHRRLRSANEVPDAVV